MGNDAKYFGSATTLVKAVRRKTGSRRSKTQSKFTSPKTGSKQAGVVVDVIVIVVVAVLDEVVNVVVCDEELVDVESSLRDCVLVVDVNSVATTLVLVVLDTVMVWVVVIVVNGGGGAVPIKIGTEAAGDSTWINEPILLF